jgi:hypothetical protein
MLNPFIKYFGLKQGDGGEELKWLPSVPTYPLRNFPGSAVTTAQLERSITVQDFNCRLFDMRKSEDLQEYKSMRDRQVSGWYKLLHIERYFDPANGKHEIYVEWATPYTEIPESLKDMPFHTPDYSTR